MCIRCFTIGRQQRGCQMKMNEIDEIARPRIIKAGNSIWSERECVIQPFDGEKQCFYCNFSLKCGQQECIWREDCA